jgi:hypothetical protein
MRVRASHEGAPGDAGQNDIVDVSAFSLNDSSRRRSALPM